MILTPKYQLEGTFIKGNNGKIVFHTVGLDYDIKVEQLLESLSGKHIVITLEIKNY